MIIIIGLPGTGKTTTAKHLVEHYPDLYNAYIDMSDIVLEMSKNKDGTDMIGNEQILNILIEKLKSHVTTKTIVVGLRESYIINYLVRNYDARVFCIDLLHAERVGRLLNDGLSYKKIKQKDVDSYNIGLFEAMYMNVPNVVFISGRQKIHHVGSEIVIRNNRFGSRI